MSKTNPERSLKSLNMKWLVMLASLDVVVVLLFAAPEFIKDATRSNITVIRGLVTALLPVIIMLLTGMLSHEIKARLVYWKWTNPYPGCEAFSRHGPADARIDMVALEKNVGDLPSSEVEQNKKWFKLYKLVSDDKAVVEAHKLYLMYRDMAAMSLPLVVLVPLGLWLGSVHTDSLWIITFFLIIQFMVCSLSARNSGTRFVCNVLSIHSTKKIPKTAKVTPVV